MSLQVAAETGSQTSTDWVFGGHGKYQFIYSSLPKDSIFQEVSGNSLQDHNLEIRLTAKARHGNWGFNTHAQLIAVHSDTLSASRHVPNPLLPGAGVINDDRRWFNLTHSFTNEGKNASVARLDRLSVSYTGDHAVVRFGRQAISWGNGLLYTPMDIFNPFDPTAVDKEYKSGDDMLYGQYLYDSGNDLQAVAVVRRNPLNGEVEAEQSSFALKYHGFVGGYEYDLLLSDHYDNVVVGVGGSADIAGAVWRGDLMMADTDDGTVLTAVAGTSYSWVTAGHNWTGALEYYYNGFGQADSDYSGASLLANPELLKRLARGELYSLGRHYLGISTMVEISPLLMLSPNAFINLEDPSALAQFVLTYDWKQDVQILAALNIPLGSKGTEFGGIEVPASESYFSTGTSVFAQLAWYF